MTLREMLREFFRTWPGRAGVALLSILAILSIVAVVIFPRNFGTTKWSNPAVWADNPKSVPPTWAKLFSGSHQLRHTSLKALTPSDIQPDKEQQVRTYLLSYHYSGAKAPKFLSFTLDDITFNERAPLISVRITRPDGSEAIVYQEAVRGPQDGESAPFHRFREEPLRIALTSDPVAVEAVREMYRDVYAVNARTSDLRPVMNRAIFGLPRQDAPGGVELLPGDYQFNVQVVTYNAADAVGSTRFVIGGTTFGLMGTDGQGRDLAQGLLFGLPVALLIGIIAALGTTIIGAGLGIAGGYVGGKTDLLVQRFADIVNNVPLLPLLIFFVFVVGPHVYLILLLLVAFSWPGLTILLRSMVLQIRSGQLVESSVAMGASKWRIMYRHIFPQMAPYIISQMIFLVPGAILAEAGLSFLGLGDPSIPTWGQILENGFRTGAVYLGYWWWVIPPGALIIITAVAFMFIALGLEPVVNPKLRRSR